MMQVTIPYPAVICNANKFSNRYKLNGRNTNKKAKTRNPENNADLILREELS